MKKAKRGCIVCLKKFPEAGTWCPVCLADTRRTAALLKPAPPPTEETLTAERQALLLAKGKLGT